MSMLFCILRELWDSHKDYVNTLNFFTTYLQHCWNMGVDTVINSFYGWSQVLDSDLLVGNTPEVGKIYELYDAPTLSGEE